ncbi:uncharacterized protein LOC124235547 isoform X3 [Equus quagga]|uniref:uncharacterized protein LOC124235547 isoform X3 n=1 Tax=Equus quagga TaxID=89248 RepID=UPI001D04A3AA|nr:uncharacterized protein LOC106831317 isoform X3 [Equus asinus]XP_046509689.1 uncharacterized protein LOC124235547 isoform X3 [Equus quagga]
MTSSPWCCLLRCAEFPKLKMGISSTFVLLYTFPRPTEDEQISGVSVIQERDCGLRPGGVVAPGPCSEDPVQGRDAGELQPPRLRGVLCYQTRSDFQIGAWRRAVDIRGRVPNPEAQRHSSWCKTSPGALLVSRIGRYYEEKEKSPNSRKFGFHLFMILPILNFWSPLSLLLPQLSVAFKICFCFSMGFARCFQKECQPTAM